MLTKPRDPSKSSASSLPARRKRGFSPFMLIGATVTVLIALIGVGIFAYQQLTATHAAATPNPNCTLIIPNNPLTAQGLATPYQLTATNAGNGPCNEANANQSAFVQADILNPATGQISAYEPLVIDKGTTPAIQPVAPTLPANAVVGIWFGFNGTILTLQNNAQTRGHGRHFNFMLRMQGGANGNCVNGLGNSPFGQFGYCNAVNFFAAANRAIKAGLLKVPALGTSTVDNEPCPSTESFDIVDMDQSDNVQTQYLANGNGQIAQFSAANQAQLQNATTLANPSDNALLSQFVDPALGCTAWQVPDLVNNNNPTATYGTDALQAMADQQAPVALVPGGDEMVLVNGQQNLQKVNLYRIGADEPPAASLNGNAATDANTTTYCQNIISQAIPRLQLDMATFQQKPSPDGGATATTLFGFLANRLNATLGPNGLNCTGLLNIQNPVTLTTNGNGVVTSATLTATPLPANATATATTTTTTTTGTTTTTTTNTATGTVNAILDTNAGTAQIATNLTIANFANQTFFVNVTDSSTGTQLLHQQENTDANGANAATTTINNLNIQTIPNTWVATITDANGNTLGSANFVSNGATAVATLTATSTSTTTTTGTTTTTTATPTTAATGTNTNGNHHHGFGGGNGNGRHHG
jgi:hypothetical protein